MDWELSKSLAKRRWPSTTTMVDFGLIGGIGLVLALVHLLATPSLQSQLALAYHDSQWWSFYTSAFVHHSDTHLLSNLAGYSVAIGMAYGLAREMGHRRWFRLSLLALVVVGPAVISASSSLVWTQVAASVSGESRGFSGVVGGCVGLAAVALVLWIGTRWRWGVAWWAGFALYLLMLVELSVIYTGGVGVDVGVLAGSGLLWTGWQLSPSLAGIGTDDWPECAFGGLLVVLLGLLVFSLFPTQLTIGGGPTTDIVAHGVGLVVGVVGSVGVWFFQVTLCERGDDDLSRGM